MQKPERLPSDHTDIDESFSDVFETHLTDWSYAISPLGCVPYALTNPTSTTTRFACPWPRPKPWRC